MCNSLAFVKNEVAPLLNTIENFIFILSGKFEWYFFWETNWNIQGNAEREMPPTKLMQWLRITWTGMRRNAISVKQKVCPYSTWICPEMVRWFQNTATIQLAGKLPSYLRESVQGPYSTYRIMAIHRLASVSFVIVCTPGFPSTDGIELAMWIYETFVILLLITVHNL